MVRHALSNRALRGSHDIWKTVNRGGRAFCSAHPWPWLADLPATISGTENREYIDLPLDFGEMLSITCPDRNWSPRPATLVEVSRLREAAQGSGDTITTWALGWRTEKKSDARPRQVIEVHPTPTTDGDPELTLRYVGTWRELDESNPDAVPNVPAQGEQALLDCCVQLALHFEDSPEQPSPDVRLLPSVDALVKACSRKQVDFGRMRGGADSLCLGYGGGPSTTVFDSVTYPS